MTTARVQRAQAHAWVTLDARDSTGKAVEMALLAECQKACTDAGLLVLVSQPHTVHWQTQVVPWDGADLASMDPGLAKPYRDGDIIPDGWRAMWLLVVTVAAYDPREGTR